MGIRKTFLVAVTFCLVVLSGCGLSGNSEIRRLEKQVATLEAQVDNLLIGIEDNWAEGVKVMRRASASHLVRVWVYVDGKYYFPRPPRNSARAFWAALGFCSLYSAHFLRSDSRADCSRCDLSISRRAFSLAFFTSPSYFVGW